MNIKESINVQGTEIILLSHKKEDFISLTDMAKYKNVEATGFVISHWLNTRYTAEYMGIWEEINNPNFNVHEFGNIKNKRFVQLNTFAITQMKSLLNSNTLEKRSIQENHSISNL